MTGRQHWSRRAVLKLGVAGTAITAVPALGAPSRADIVTVTGGQVEGIATRTAGVRAWLGMPYAAPPVGPLRWRAPQPVVPWSGVRSAARFSKSPWAPPEREHSVFGAAPPDMDEDCLTVNVWAPPRGKKPAPVLVWIYGGAFVSGSSNYPHYHGENLAAEGIVFVSLNYRVGVLGFFAHPELRAESPDGVSGNYGLMDQVAALRWVRDNIAAFGGDPAQVTISGQSAGAFSVAYHMVMPASRGLFHGAIAESGAPMGKPSSYILLGELEPMEKDGVAFCEKLHARHVDELRALSPAALVKAYEGSWLFYAAVDGKVVPDHPFELMRRGQHANVPLIAGFNHNEGEVFRSLGDTVAEFNATLQDIYGPHAGAARELFAVTNDAQAVAAGHAVFGDKVFNWNTAALTTVQARYATAAAYMYHFAYAHALPADTVFAEGKGGELGAYHAAEIPYALMNLDSRPWPASVEQSQFMRQVSSYWVNFTKTGNPNAPSLPEWPRYVADEPTVLRMDAGAFSTVDLPFRERLELMGAAMDNDILVRKPRGAA